MARPKTPNPLAIAFGAALRSARQGIATRVVAKAVEVVDSSYRLIESGRNHVSMAKAPAIYRAFRTEHQGRKPQELSLDAITLFLAAIAGSEDRDPSVPLDEGRGQRLHDNSASLYRALPEPHRLRQLLQRFLNPIQRYVSVDLPASHQDLSILQCVDVPDADVRELVAQAHLDMQAIWFMTLYTTESSTAVEGGYFESFFMSIPSMYAPLLEDLRANIEQLPDDLVSRGSRKWEEKHKAGFRELVAVCQSSHFVQTENLTEYRYDYLWNEQFEKATFLLLDTKKPGTVRRTFQRNLSSVLKESDRLEDRDRLSTLEQVFTEKTAFIPTKDLDSQDIEELLTCVEDEGPFDAMWVFLTVKGALIGAAARFAGEAAIASSITYLTFGQCSAAARKLRKLLPEVL